MLIVNVAGFAGGLSSGRSVGMHSGAAPRFLAVDDEMSAQRSYQRLLEAYGRVVVVPTAAEARRQFTACADWRAFLFDLRLEDGTGLELLAEARRIFPVTPAVIVTGHVENWVANAAYDLDADVLGKPFEDARMHRWIERALGVDASTRLPSIEPEALREKVRALRALLARRPADMRTRYAIGQLVVELKRSPDRYGAGAVAAACAALGEDMPSLYRHARVAERWSPVEFEVLRARSMPDGRPLSWSHCVMLATVRPGATYTRLLDKTLERALTVRELEAEIEDSSARQARASG